MIVREEPNRCETSFLTMELLKENSFLQNIVTLILKKPKIKLSELSKHGSGSCRLLASSLILIDF